MLLCEEVADSWREVEEQQADLRAQLRETDQHLQSLARRPAELEPKIVQNQLDKAQVCHGEEDDDCDADGADDELCVCALGEVMVSERGDGAHRVFSFNLTAR